MLFMTVHRKRDTWSHVRLSGLQNNKNLETISRAVVCLSSVSVFIKCQVSV